jgi:hypothetical protein
MAQFCGQFTITLFFSRNVQDRLPLATTRDLSRWKEFVQIAGQLDTL